ncbi:PREDICTED: COMM domain-containing protein 7 isoform X1 [Colobus angolensis palliatus]|uniref:COMM domain-containing protein 7 isoform X1 n=1 Tax=Colobus angolensis palliatus TaxID=336983 RepID=UPI0005F4AE55|nr:PREDICTED: COMM domain-containing protein 7 isoform X1 [Colobus angolensis palliatus]
MGRLHCTEDPVPETVGCDMQQLNQLGAQQFSALTEVLFHFLTEPKEVERFLAQLSEFATTNRISLGSLRSIVKSLLLVPNGALKKSLTAKQVQADFITLGLSEEKATYFSEKWKQNAPTLARWAIGQTLMINQLIDMEWKFGVTSGSSELEKVGSIFLQLKLVVKKGNQTENVYIGEINLASVLQLPARDGASQNQHGVFLLISVPTSPLAPFPALLPSLGDCSERHFTHRSVGCSMGPRWLLGSPGAKGF